MYIIPKSDCVAANDNHFYPNEQIEKCFILRSPDEAGGVDLIDSLAQRDEAARVQYSSTRDQFGGMQQVSLRQLNAIDIAQDHEVVDHSDFPPTVLSCVAAVAVRPQEGIDSDLVRHRAIEQARTGCQLWEENVVRFTEQEMAAALYSIDQALLRSLTLAFYYTDRASAQTICDVGGGIEATTSAFGRGVVVCTTSPVELGWRQGVGAEFRDTVGRVLQPDVRDKSLHALDLDVMLVVAVPTTVIRDVRNQCVLKSGQIGVSQRGMYKIPEKFLSSDGSYSNAHIHKCYLINPAAAKRSDAENIGRPSTRVTATLPEVDTSQAGPELTSLEVEEPNTIRSRFASAINIMEEKTGWDIDQDGKVGTQLKQKRPPPPLPPTSPSSESTSGTASRRSTTPTRQGPPLLDAPVSGWARSRTPPRLPAVNAVMAARRFQSEP